MRVSFFILGTSVINAWLLYRKECSFFQVPGKHQFDLIKFYLVHSNKAILSYKRGRSRSRINKNILSDSHNSSALSLDLSID